MLLRQLLHQFLAPLVQILRDGDLHLHILVSHPPVLLDPHLRQPESRSAVRPRGYAKHHVLTIHRADAELRAECGLRDVDGDGAVDVQASAAEEAVRLHIEP